MLYRGRQKTCEGDPDPQQRDLEILRALHRYRYLATRQIADIPSDAKWRPRDAVDIDYVWHDLEVNDWMLAYTRLLGEPLDDWLGPAEARVEIESASDPSRRRHVRLSADRVSPHATFANELQLGDELQPVLNARTLWQGAASGGLGAPAHQAAETIIPGASDE